jgi:RHS repeat-associated protein
MHVRLHRDTTTDHLGNVRATVSDMLLPRSGNDFDADLRTLTDYYPFGMQMPGRNYEAAGIDGHRYGYNGKENDNEVKGEGNQQDYGFRIYDPRVARFLSVDPLAKSFAWYTPYQFAGNGPILHIDLDGLEEVNAVSYFMEKLFFGKQLRKSEWLDIDRHCACRTFADAAEYNTTALNSRYYQPINQIHNYYQWADERLQAASVDIRWFKAAEEVTSPVTGIGASSIPGSSLIGFDEDATEFLEKGNSFLFGKNISMMKAVLSSRAFQGLTGQAADNAMVKAEQTAMTGFMQDYEKRIGAQRFNKIMDNLNTVLNMELPLVSPDYIKKAKEKVGGSIDFRNQDHREALGTALVDEIRNPDKDD